MNAGTWISLCAVAALLVTATAHAQDDTRVDDVPKIGALLDYRAQHLSIRGVTHITAATGLSLSSIATNTRLGAGGPYAIISRSLGLEVGGLETAMGQAPRSDLDILGARREIDLDFVRRMVRASRSACLFTSDSGQESALA